MSSGTYNYKCTTGKCRRRRTLKRLIETYTHEPRCKHCKGEDGKGGKFKLDPWTKPRDKKRTCTCDALDYPHSKGSNPWCKEHPTGPTERDYIERYGVSYIEDCPVRDSNEDWEAYCEFIQYDEVLNK